jgi:hypothetical protein
MSYMVAAYAVLWAVSFGLVFGIVFRQRRLDSELQALRVIVEDEPRTGLAVQPFEAPIRASELATGNCSGE